MNKKLLITIMVILFFASTCGVYGAVQRGIIATSSGTATNLSYESGDGSYWDGSPNPDVQLRVYADAASEINNKYVGLVYLVGINSGNAYYGVFSRGTSGRLVRLPSSGASLDGGSGWWYHDTGMSLQIAADDTDDGTALIETGAFFPTIPTLVVSNDDQVDVGSDTFVLLSTEDGWLRGSYGLNSNLQLSYNQTTGNISFDVTSVTSTSQNSKPFLLSGSCTDTYGQNCADTINVSLSDSAVPLYTGIVSPPDTTTYTRYAVVNGIGSSYCIGPDLRVTDINMNPSVGPPGTNVTISADVINENNVDITQTFTIKFYNETGGEIGSKDIAGLTEGSSTTTDSFIWNTEGLTTDDWDIEARIVRGSIADCQPSDDNLTEQFIIRTVYIGYVWVDDVYTDNFSNAGRPYNVTFQINHSDGYGMENVTILLTEENGINLFSPIQAYNDSGNKRGVKSRSTAVLKTGNNGLVSATIIPTGNKIYLDEYNYTNIIEYVGNYSIYFELYNSSNLSQKLDLYDPYNGEAVDQKNLTLLNQSYSYPDTADRQTLNTFQRTTYVNQMASFMYDVLGTVRSWLQQ